MIEIISDAEDRLESKLSGITSKYYIFKNIMKLCKLELARRRVLLETKDKRQYLASVIRTNKLLTEREAKISF